MVAAVVLAAPAAAERVAFTSPSGNIGCVMDNWSVRCDIRTRYWDPPPRAAGCPEDMGFGQGISMSAGEPGGAVFVCAYDSVLSTADPLSYGQERQLDSIRCVMLQAGVACEDFHTGRGFSLSRERYEFF